MTKLKNILTSPPETFSKKECKKELAKYKKNLFELQNIFYADNRFALLIIFQGVDTSGKDGTRCYRNYKVAKINTTHLQFLQLKYSK